MLTRVNNNFGRPWISRPRVAACLVAVAAAFASSSAYAQGCSGGGGGGGGGGAGGRGGGGGTGTASGIAGAGLSGVNLAAAGQVHTGQAFLSVPTLAMFEPAFPHVVDDNKQYVAERRAMREAKLALARERLAMKGERTVKRPRTIATLARS